MRSATQAPRVRRRRRVPAQVVRLELKQPILFEVVERLRRPLGRMRPFWPISGHMRALLAQRRQGRSPIMSAGQVCPHAGIIVLGGPGRLSYSWEAHQNATAAWLSSALEKCVRRRATGRRRRRGLALCERLERVGRGQPPRAGPEIWSRLFGSPPSTLCKGSGRNRSRPVSRHDGTAKIEREVNPGGPQAWTPANRAVTT